MNGVIEGGWSYVWAAYAVSAVAFALYTYRVVARFRRDRARWLKERGGAGNDRAI